MASALDQVEFFSSSSYRVLEEIGRGGMGIVFLAEKNCEGVRDYVVLKTIRTMKPEQIERLRQEANTATLLRHENIVKTYGLEAIPLSAVPEGFRRELGALHTAPVMPEPEAAAPGVRLPASRRRLAPGRPPVMARPAALARPPVVAAANDERLFLMVMDYIEGADLGGLFRDHLSQSLLIPVPLGAFIVSRVCRALAYAHEYIIHRDVTPENILVNNQGVAKLTDFGIAVSAGEGTQEFAGKLMYMAPEQLFRQPIDHRCDIYALGIVSYLIATGINLFRPPPGLGVQAQMDYVAARMDQPIVPPHEVLADVPQAYSDIIMGMLERDPNRRTQTMAECGNQLEGGYIYAAGWGPTNNSLMAYMDIFFKGFTGADQQQLKQLAFLRNKETGKITVKRRISFKDYLPAGRDLIRNTQKGQLIYKVLATQQTASQPAQ